MSHGTVLTTRSWFFNPHARAWTCPPPPPGAARFHSRLPGYAPTPLVEIPELAREWGVRSVMVKDESERLGLPAFKALGVSYAVCRVVCRLAGVTAPPATLDALREMVSSLPPMELVTATDGNHGRALARFARSLGIPARVLVPDVAGAPAAEAIRAEGAHVIVVAGDYDTAVRRAAREAGSRPGAVLVQDTAWPGYEDVPQWIVDGYSTLLAEIDARLGGEPPALVVVPMGVGSLAQAVVTHYRSRGTEPPTALLGVEPDTAACVHAGLAAGRYRSVPTGSTIMAGLNCGTPSSLAWPYLRNGLDAAVTVSDGQAAAAARELAGHGVPAGPCGAACLAGVRAVLTEPGLGGRAALGLGPDSTVVLLSTESPRDLTEGETTP
ncbi:diaminopropionate ammonia-lyase [Actinomadura viridis]|uniref:Diaminopropionate ammonia-lyase n=1 Tax=Actinomadura viridis TaxID=58110 RepID=A0A931DG62_9ACTN|nr:diaminopropionate ammonia-lyase [Actinomadura viridis]MBG6088657.1 diaminopropionate ammonia-lyase [Actinomadura viridis]